MRLARAPGGGTDCTAGRTAERGAAAWIRAHGTAADAGGSDSRRQLFGRARTLSLFSRRPLTPLVPHGEREKTGRWRGEVSIRLDLSSYIDRCEIADGAG